MKKFLSNYKSTIILLVAIIVGAFVGIIFQEKATILSPFGDLFLNLLCFHLEYYNRKLILSC